MLSHGRSEPRRALPAARVIGALDGRRLTVRATHELTGTAAADFSHIRNASLGRFTIDRIMVILAALGQQIEVTVKVHPWHVGKRNMESRL
jgi:predicted XRE-type DNA-binding protein